MTLPNTPTLNWRDTRVEDWTQARSDAFAQGTRGVSETIQKLLCGPCVKNGELTPPDTIVLVNGNSLCALHA